MRRLASSVQRSAFSGLARCFQLPASCFLLLVCWATGPLGHWATGRVEAAGQVDLAVAEIIPSATQAPKVLVRVENRGDAALAKPVQVELWLDERSLGKQSLRERLASGEQAYVEFMRPMELHPGLHTFTAKVDVDKALKKEFSLENNEQILSVWSHEETKTTSKAVKRRMGHTRSRAGGGRVR